MRKTMFKKWTIDFRKILFCIVILALGTIMNAAEPKALAIALIVQGAGNVDGFWDYLDDKRIYGFLRVMLGVLITLSVLAGVFAVISLASPQNYFTLGVGNHARLCIAGAVFCVAFPVIPLTVDTILNLKSEESVHVSDMAGGENYD